MAWNKKPSEQSTSIASAEDALRQEGALGQVDREEFEDRLNDPEVRDNLETARKMWKKVYGRDPVSSRDARP